MAVVLAGGEPTPFLQGVYREVRARSKAYDGPSGGLDERKMTEAIDRLVAQVESEKRP